MALELFGEFGFPGAFDQAANPYQDAQTCINFYPEAVPTQTSKEVIGLLGAPGLVQVASYIGEVTQFEAITAATVVNPGGQSSGSYSPGDTINLVGGTYTTPAVVTVATTQLSAVSGSGGSSVTANITGFTISPTTWSPHPLYARQSFPGTGGSGTGATFNVNVDSAGNIDCSLTNGGQNYQVGDVLTCVATLYTFRTPNQPSDVSIAITVTSVSNSTIAAGGSGGTPGPVVLTGTTGTGILFQINGTINSGGVLASLGSVVRTGSYTVNPTTLTHEPVSGGGLTGAAISVIMGIATVTVTSGGDYPYQIPTLTQLSTSGAGVGATFTGTWTQATGPVVKVPGSAPGFSPTMTQWPQPSSVTDIPVRGMWVLPGSTQALVVIGGACYLATIATPGSQTTPGTLNMVQVGQLVTTSGPVCIRDNNAGGHAVIVDGPNGYLYNISTQTFAQIVDPAFLGATTVAFIDGWWIFNQPGAQVFYTNQPQYSQTFNATYFALKDAFTDNLVGVTEFKEELWLIGEETTEIWYDAGGQYFPFQRLIGTLMQIGCKAAATICKIAGNGQEGLIWFGRSERGDNLIIKTKGFNWEVVSTVAVSNAISKYVTTSDAFAYTYEEGGHSFYVLTFPSADVTWVYDATLPPSLAWTQRLSYDPYAAQFHRHRSNCYMNFGGMRIVGDYQNGCLYQLTRAVQNDAGWPLRSVRRSPFIWDKSNRERVFMSSLQVDFAPGQGNASGMGSNPQANLSISRDYGSTFGPAFQAPMGEIGNYTNRCMWRKLGWSRGAVAQIDVIDPVNRDIVGVTLKAFGQ